MSFWVTEEIHVELCNNEVIVTNENGTKKVLPGRKDAKPYRAFLNQDSKYFVELFEED